MNYKEWWEVFKQGKSNFFNFQVEWEAAAWQNGECLAHPLQMKVSDWVRFVVYSKTCLNPYFLLGLPLTVLISREAVSTEQENLSLCHPVFLFWVQAACWHNSCSRIFCSWQIQNCFVSEMNKTSWCFEIMCFGYWGVCWGGGKLFSALSWKEVPQRSPEKQWLRSGSSVLSTVSPAPAAPVLGGSLVLVRAGISLPGSGSWLTRWC